MRKEKLQRWIALLKRVRLGTGTPTPSLQSLVALILGVLCLPALALAAPRVTSVTSSTTNGSYKAGAVIAVNVNFSEEVTVFGIPRLTLETGVSDAVVSYSSGSGSSTLVFSYTVVSGHNTADLDYISQNALSLNGGTIQNLARNSATLTLPTPGTPGSLGANRDIRIDTTPPTVSLSLLTPSTTNLLPIRLQVTFSEAVTGFTALDPNVTNGEVTGFSGSGASYTIDISAYANGNVTVQIPASSSFDSALNGNTASSSITARYDNQTPTITGVTAAPTSGAYRATQQVTLLVNFSEAVTVNGIPSLTLETGASDGVATYTGGSGTTQLTFRYNVQSGDTSTDLEYTGTNALVLNGGSIRDAATNDATLILPALGGTGSLSLNTNIIVDTTLSAVTITSPISGDTSLDAIPVVVTFSESVTGFTLSDLSVTNGCASNLRGSGTTYYADIVPRAHGTVIVSIPSAIAVDVAGNPNTASTSPVNVNFFTFGPKVTTVTSSTPDGAYKAGQTIAIQISFSDPVTVSGIPQLRLATGSIATATYSSGSGTNTLTFDYTIASGQNSSDLDYIPLPPLSLNGGTIRDLNTDSYDAAFTFACQGASGSLGSSKNIIVDTLAPTISRITSTTANGSYRAGQTLNIRAQFSENIFVTGIPNITLETGPNDAVVSMISGSGSANLDFSYTIVDGHNSNRLDYVSTSALNANSATLVDQAGNVAFLTLPATGSSNSLAGTKNLIVDTIPPTVPNVTSTTANGAYKAGSVINIQVAFSENIFITMTPRIALATGIPNRYATYSSGSGSSTLNFSYTVAAGDTSSDLDYTSFAALETNGGTIRDQAGNDSIINLATPGSQYSLSFNKNLQLDTTAPTILSVASSAANGFYSMGATIPINVSFSEPVNVVGVPALALNTSPVQGNATYLSGTGTSTLTFVYTVAAGNNSVNLDYISTSALTLPTGATIRDPATNSAVLTLPSPGAAGSLGAQGDRAIDTTIPTLSDISFVTPNGNYRAGQQLQVDLTFSEVVVLNGSLKLQLVTNSSQGVATCATVLSVTSLRCSYTILAGDNSGDLDYQSTTSLSVGSVSSSLVDLAGNSADLTLPTAGGPLSLAGKSAVIVDTTPPSATLTSSSQNTTNLNPIQVTITFSEAVTGLELTDFNVTNCSVQNLSGSGFSYTAQLVPQTQGIVQVNLKNNSVLDLAGNTNSASLTLQRTYDSVRPSVALTSAASDPTNASTIPILITFSESVTGFTTSGITVTNGSVTSLIGSGTTYTAQIVPSSDGVVTASIPDNVGFDAGSNGNTQSLSLSRTYDSTLPVVTTVTATTPNGYYREGAEITILVVWSEPVVVTGIPRLDLAVSATPALASYVSGSGSSVLTFSYTVAAGHNSQDLDYTSTTALQLIGATIKDNATNSAVTTLPTPGSANSLGGQRDIVIDTVTPTATLSSTAPSITNQNPIPVVITFTEAVTGLTVEDFTVVNGILQNLIGSGSSYSAQLVPQEQGITQISLKVASVTDSAGNTNQNSANFQRVYDSLRPSVRINSSSADTSNTNIIPATIVFSEPVGQFTSSDITVTNGTIATFSGSDDTYSIGITPSTDGAVELFIPPNVAFDSGGNGNLGSDTLSRFFDSTPPRILSVTSSTGNGYYREGATISIQVVCSEPVYVTGAPRLALDLGSGTTWASYVGGSESNTLTFSYTVVAGNNSPDLDYPDISALQLDGGTIKDLATNSAAAILPLPGSPNSLAGQKAVVIDTTTPSSPVITEPITGSIIKRAQAEIKGTSEELARIEIKDAGGTTLCTATSSDSGTWSCMVSDLADGAYQIISSAEDLAGNKSANSDSTSFTIDLLALDAPTFLEPENGGSTDSRPTFSGIAPANKKVRVRRGGATLCLAEVTASGSWSCQSAESLSPGRYEITGTTEDSADLTTSSATPLTLIVGGRLTGIVLLANRDLTPLDGVEIKDQNLSLTTNSSGTFSLVTPNLSDPKISLKKFGWRIEQSTTLSDRARQSQATAEWLATPALESEVYTVWGGSNTELKQQLRILNRSGSAGQSQVSLFGSDGSLCAKIVSTDIVPNATELIDLSQNSCLTKGSYGLARVTFSQSDYDGSLITSRSSSVSNRWLSSYSELPLANTVSGKSYTPFDNSYRTTRQDSQRLIRRNDLIISNPNSNSMSFTVRRYSSRGSLVRSLSFSVPPLGSYQVPFDEQLENIALNGVEEIEPSDPTARYVAIMLRSGSLPGESKTSTGVFIQANYSESGFGRTFFVRVRDVAKRHAIQYLEISNISSKQANVRIKRIDTNGRARPTIPLLLKPLQTRRIRLSRLLERYEEGVAEITSDIDASLMMNSVMKHYRAYHKLRSMKSSSIQESYGDLTYGSYDASRGTQSILKISNLSSETNSGTVSCYSKSELIDSIQLTLRPGALKEIDLRKCFGRALSGVVELNSATPGTLVADLIRFKDSEDVSLRERMR